MLKLKTFGGLVIRRDGAAVAGAGGQRRRVILLAILASACERGLSRDKLLALFWPDADPERARKNLAQAVYALRKDLGQDDLITGVAELRLNPDHIRSDVAEFRHAMKQARYEEAVALYDGPFLDGVHLDDSPEFEQWAELECAQLARDYAHALACLATRAADGGDHRGAVLHWRRLLQADPLAADALAGLMTSLLAQGDKAAALQEYQAYEMLLRQQLDLTPDARLKALAAGIRRVEPTPVPLPAAPRVAAPAPALRVAEPAEQAVGITAERMVPGRVAAAVPAPRPLPAHPAAESGSRRGAGWRPLAVAAVALVVMVVGAMGAWRKRGVSEAASAPVIAVGLIQDFTRTDEGLTRPLVDMLATDLARVPGMQVISTMRMYELMAQAGRTADTAAAVMRAARASGASELIDGALHALGPGRYRLDLKRTDLATGSVHASYSVEGSDLFALVSDARAQLASRSGLGAGGGTIADVTTRSMVAYRLYEQGLRALVSSDTASARRLLDQALAEDSLFAMAAYWLARSGGPYDKPRLLRGLDRAMRLAPRASERERLLIHAEWAAITDHPARVEVAETLTLRYPTEPDGYLFLGRGRLWSGDFLGAIAPFQRVLAMDSVSLAILAENPGGVTACHACEAYGGLIEAYHHLDSLPAFVRVAREWLRRQPTSVGAATRVAHGYLFQDRLGEALAAAQVAMAIDPDVPQDALRAQVALRRGDLASAEAYYRALAAGPPPQRGEGWKFMSVLKRMRGRPTEALEWGLQLQATSDDPLPPGSVSYNGLFAAAARYDMGQYAWAAALLDSITLAAPDSTASRRARHRIWTQTHRATALAAAGDTTELAALADSVEQWGHASSYGRDRRLHHHIRGLLATARGNPGLAAREFEQALFSPVLGYTRTNLELARAYLQLGRPRDAAHIASAALRGTYDGPNLYANRTELSEMAALAWDAAGEPDSALVRYREVLANWTDAEPRLHRRREHARLRVAALSVR